jgi:hypothetical protein
MYLSCVRIAMAKLRFPTMLLGRSAPIPWSVCQCEECGLGFDYDDSEVESDPDKTNERSSVMNSGTRSSLLMSAGFFAE